MMLSASEARDLSIKGLYDSHYEAILSTVRAFSAQGKRKCFYELRDPLEFNESLFQPLTSALKTQGFEVKIRREFWKRRLIKGFDISWS